MNISDRVEEVINSSIQSYDGDFELGNTFEKLISLGEIIDRLSIVNFKLYRLKDEVMEKPDDKEFRSWASEEDVKLVEERSRLKRCIDEKVLAMFGRFSAGDKTAGFNPEVKKYGE
tara:strand:- start:2210 stop:2557 length:348 start_codon:yes stop_codon:yes gene_type:complete